MHSLWFQWSVVLMDIEVRIRLELPLGSLKPPDLKEEFA